MDGMMMMTCRSLLGLIASLSILTGVLVGFVANKEGLTEIVTTIREQSTNSYDKLYNSIAKGYQDRWSDGEDEGRLIRL